MIYIVISNEQNMSIQIRSDGDSVVSNHTLVPLYSQTLPSGIGGATNDLPEKPMAATSHKSMLLGSSLGNSLGLVTSSTNVSFPETKVGDQRGGFE